MSFKLEIQPVTVNARRKKNLIQIWHTDYKDCATIEEAARMLVIDLLKQKCDDQFAMNIVKNVQKTNKDINFEKILQELNDRKLLSDFIKGYLNEIEEQEKNKKSDSDNIKSKTGATE